MKVIIIDDDEELLNLLDEYLSNKGLEICKVNSGVKALEILEKEHFDMAILDIMMPGMDGLEVLRHINTDFSYLPVIMLTAMGGEPDRVIGLELGADDYIAKPFSSRELFARIKAIVRRQEKVLKKEHSLPSGTIKIDLEKREVIKHGKAIELSSVEFDVLSILVQNKGIVLSRDRLMDLARGKDFMAFDRSVDVHISHLRQKLENDPKNPTLIKTVWGVGYIYTGG
ncbi:MAG: response regulator [Candidatus Eremiobacterota bacterium]